MSTFEGIVLTFGIVNLAFAGLVYFHSTRSIMVAFYSAISVFASLWSVATLATGIPNLSDSSFLLAMNLHYIFGNLAYLSFFWFSVYYPERTVRSLKWPIILTSINIAVLASVAVLGLFFEGIVPTANGGHDVFFNAYGYSAFILALTSVFVAGLFMLLGKLKRYSSQEQRQLFYAILANFVAGNLGIYLNLIFPFFGDFRFFYVNPVLVTIALTGIGLYNLVRNKLFNMKVILAELFMVGILISLLFQFLNETDAQQKGIQFVIFAIIFIFGMFLIKSVFTEVRQREQLEIISAELKAANEELKRLDEQKSDFITIASHQLRTPLSIVKGYISMIFEKSFGAVPGNLVEPLNRVNVSNNRLINLVNDLLDLSRIERGKMTYVFQSGSVTDVVEEVYKEMGEAAKQKRLEFYFKKPDHPIPQCNIDPKKIKEVLINFIDNALHYTNEGSVTLHVMHIPERKVVRVSVADTGIGMTAHDIAHIFVKFSRMENAKHISSEGTGLGLYVAKLIIEDHKGTIWAESDGPGKGSTFAFELPVIS